MNTSTTKWILTTMSTYYKDIQSFFNRIYTFTINAYNTKSKNKLILVGHHIYFISVSVILGIYLYTQIEVNDKRILQPPNGS